MKKAVPGLRHLFFPYKRICQVPLDVIQNTLCQIFERRNKPGSFRVDNGEPFGSPQNDTPPPIALWLIAYDIDMIWNKPACPQMNGVVEHMQDTSSRWADIEHCYSTEELQQRLDKEAKVQRSMFPVSRLSNKTRLQSFPEIEKSNRAWEPEAFCPQRVYDFLAKRIFTRKVSKSGQISHFGKQFTVTTQLKGILVQVKMNPQNLEWEIYHDYKIVKKHTALPYISSERIQNLSVYQ